MKTNPVRVIPENESPETTVDSNLEHDLDNVEQKIIDTTPVRVQPITLLVRRQFRESGELIGDLEEEDEEIAVQDFHVDPARVSLRLNHTHNLGNYTSISIQVGIEVPCYREEFDAAFEFASKQVVRRLLIEVPQAEERAEEFKQRKRSGPHPF